MSVRSCVPSLADSATNTLPSGLGLYIHVPFCLQKCLYCSFYSVTNQPDLYNRYAAAVKEQILRFAERSDIQAQQVHTIFFGGGTPSILGSDLLTRLLKNCFLNFDCAPGLETSLEVNPATVDQAALHELRRAGFNRISIGVQSFDDRELEVLGRVHSAADGIRTVQMARRAGFSNINLDLMYGLPDQDKHKWQESLQQALSLQPEHLSLYELTMEGNTPFAQRYDRGELRLPEEEVVLAMVATTEEMVTAAGLHRYEISNYARPDRKCSHNINYWHNASWLGLGPGAVSSLNGCKIKTISDVECFCQPGANKEERETLDNEAAFRETVVMGLRMIGGIGLEELEKRFAINAISYYGTTLDRLIAHNLVTIEEGRLRLTGQGLLLANTVMAELV